jgi:putative transposase
MAVSSNGYQNVSSSFGRECYWKKSGRSRQQNPSAGGSTGVPLAVHITGANIHDKWVADELIVSIAVARPDPDEVEQHLVWIEAMISLMFISLSSLNATWFILNIGGGMGNPSLRIVLYPGETQFPARRWVVERTLRWLAKRRVLRICWCKNPIIG